MEDNLNGNSRGNLIDNKPAGGKRSELRFLLPLAMILTVAAIACGGSTSGSSSIVGDGNSFGSNNPAPDFTITMFQGQDAEGGEEVSLHSLIGDQPVVLNFWAGLCPPCRAEMPDLQAFNEEFKDRALLLGVDLGQFTGLGTQKDAKDLLAELGVTYPAGFTSDADVIRDYQVLGMPTTIFIDRNGEIFNKWTGALNGKILKEKTLEMLDQ